MIGQFPTGRHDPPTITPEHTGSHMAGPFPFLVIREPLSPNHSHREPLVSVRHILFATF